MEPCCEREEEVSSVASTGPQACALEVVGKMMLPSLPLPLPVVKTWQKLLLVSFLYFVKEKTLPVLRLF